VRSDTLVRPQTRTMTNGLLHLNFHVSGAMLEAARECEEAVFLKAFGNTREQLDEEYGPYDDQSVFVTVSDADDFVVGACRIITPGPAGFKTLNDIKGEPWSIDGERSARAAGADLAATWDVGTLGVRDSHRGSGIQVAMALYHSIIRGARINGIGTAVAILDEQARRVLAALDHRQVPLPGTRSAPYLGSKSSTPVYYHTSMLDAQRRANPESFRMLVHGHGLEGIALPDDSAFLLPATRPVVPRREVAA
jgi:hypothetical protein